VLSEQTIPEPINCIKQFNAGIKISFDRERLLRAFIYVVDPGGVNFYIVGFIGEISQV
jgi:hypothetical protein